MTSNQSEEPKTIRLNDLPQEEFHAAATGLHDYLVRTCRALFLPELRKRVASGAVLSDLVVAIVDHDSGVFPDEAKVAGAHGNFLDPDGKPARGPDGKHLWPLHGVIIRTRQAFAEYFSTFTESNGEMKYKALVGVLADPPEPNEENYLAGYWVVVFHGAVVTIAAKHWPPDYNLRTEASTAPIDAHGASA